MRGLTQESAVGRTITEKLFNIGGMLTHGHTQGRFVMNVEDLSTVYMAKYEMDVLPQARKSTPVFVQTSLVWKVVTITQRWLKLLKWAVV